MRCIPARAARVSEWGAVGLPGRGTAWTQLGGTVVDRPHVVWSSDPRLRRQLEPWSIVHMSCRQVTHACGGSWNRGRSSTCRVVK